MVFLIPIFPGAFRRNVGPSVVPGWTVRRSLRIYCLIFITYTQNTLFCVLGAAHAREVYVEKDRASGRNRDLSVRYTTSINLGPCIRGFGFHLDPGVMTTSLTNWATSCCPRNLSHSSTKIFPSSAHADERHPRGFGLPPRNESNVH